jgi:hypothetical protein
LQNNFRARLYKMYTINAPSSIYWAWKLIKPLMEESTASKITFVKENTTEDMWLHINKSQVEKRFGGSAANVAEFWYRIVCVLFKGPHLYDPRNIS